MTYSQLAEQEISGLKQELEASPDAAPIKARIRRLDSLVRRLHKAEQAAQKIKVTLAAAIGQPL